MTSPKGEEATSSTPFEGEFRKYFMRMQTIVEDHYQYWKRGGQGGQSNAC